MENNNNIQNQNHNQLTPIKTTLVAYRFDISEEPQKTEYSKLCEHLKELGLTSKKHACIADKNPNLETREVLLSTKFLFSNQWNEENSAEQTGRLLFDWCEPIFPNKNIKEGYYLIPTPKMEEVRQTTYKCGYCGKHYYNYHEHEHSEFCLSCLNSPYLEESQFHLLRLQAVSKKGKRSPLTNSELAFLKPLYIKAQTICRNAEKAKKLLKLKEAHKKALHTANTEYEGYTWLINNDINTENVIYYPHHDQFCFGWRKPLSKCVLDELLGKLEDFPFHFTIKE